jgi:hypothetical protein
MSVTAVVLVLWVFLSLPFAMFLGRVIRGCEHRSQIVRTRMYKSTRPETHLP